MKANQPVTLKIKKGDTVVVLTGREKGKTGKVLAVHPASSQVTVEGVNIVTKHVKRTQTTTKGSIEKIAKPIAVSKIAIAHPDKEGRTSRIGYKVTNGAKTRVYKANNKEIK